MSQDETANLRQKLKAWWRATTDVFEPSVSTGEGQTAHADAKAKHKEQHQKDKKVAPRKGYSGHWNTLAFGIGLFGGGIFGASFNFYTAKDFGPFWVLFWIGTVMVVFAIVALSLHASREQTERDLIQARADGNARIDAVVADFRVLHKETEYRERLNSETYLLLQCSPFRLRSNDELREACQRIVAFKLPDPIKPFRDDADPLAFLRYCDGREIAADDSIPTIYHIYRGSFGWTG